MKPPKDAPVLNAPEWKPVHHGYREVLDDQTGAKHFALGDYGDAICTLQCELAIIANADDKTGTVSGFLAKEAGSFGRVTEGYLKSLESRSIIAIKYDGRCIDGSQLRDLRRKVEQIRLASQTIQLSRIPATSY